MKSKRWILILVVLVAGLAFVVVMAQLWPDDEPTHQGKTVSAWFKEYAYGSNTTTRPVAARLTPQMHLSLAQAQSNGASPQLFRVLSNNYIMMASAQFSRTPPREPALDALLTLGSNAVPCLVQHLRIGPLDRSYERAVTNLPVFVQRRLPNPAQKRWYRFHAMRALAQLKDSARGATPALLELLRKPEPLSRGQVLSTLRSIYADAYSISTLLLELGKEQRYADVLEIAWQTKWQGREVAHLFGEILQATNTALHRDAIWLLEASGERAAPALDAILAALQSPDGEVRYLAARTVENIGRKVPPEALPRIAAALEGSLNDEKDTVRNVARRALAKLNGALETTAPAGSAPRLHDVTHQGKTTEQWFHDYIAGAGTRIPPHVPAVMNGELLWPSPARDKPDPAWKAFQALGEKAVPCLVRHLDLSGESADQAQTHLERRQAIELMHRLGTKAQSAAPSLLTLLRQVEESEAEAVCAAIAKVRPVAHLINQFLVDLGKAQRNADMLRFARRLGWSGPEVAQLLGGLLRSLDREVSHDAAALLEAAGPGAQAVVEQITGALQNADQEIRYLAARSLASMATNTPAARKALQGLIDDQNEMVRGVARRAVR